MSGEKRNKDKDWLKRIITAKKENLTAPVIVGIKPESKSKIKISASMRTYQEITGEAAINESGEKTARYEEWYRTEWPVIKAEREEEVESTTITTTTYKKREKVATAPNLSLLIQESVNTLRTLTEYIKDLKENPIKVQILK